MAKRFEVVVTEIEDVNLTKSIYQKIADTGNQCGGGPVYGYVGVDVTEEKRREVFRQTVDCTDEFKLWNVVQAVNGDV